MGWALAAMTGLALGGGYGTYTARAEAQAVRVEMQAEVEKLEDKLERAADEVSANQLRIVEGLTELKTDIKYIRERLDANAR